MFNILSCLVTAMLWILIVLSMRNGNYEAAWIWVTLLFLEHLDRLIVREGK